MEEQVLSLLENVSAKKNVWSQEREKTADWKNCVMRNFKICTLHQIFLERSNQ
jgi:hypothetical protein